MSIRNDYDAWSATYDAVANRTRDLEAIALRTVVPDSRLHRALELGCGTGKNTGWLAERAAHVTAVDFSAGMLALARQRHALAHVDFVHGDITCAWDFVAAPVDLVTCSLVLEHVQDLDSVFAQAASAMAGGALFYVGELHPFRQYGGSKARYEAADGGTREIDAHVHHVSDYFRAASDVGLTCLQLSEWFDDEGRTGTPRLVSFLFRKAG
jgi:SAM-dependent methyltransferase